MKYMSNKSDNIIFDIDHSLILKYMFSRIDGQECQETFTAKIYHESRDYTYFSG